MLTDFVKSGVKTLVLFDMDGVLAEYKWGENEAIQKGDTEVYRLKRPITSVIEVARTLYMDGVDVGVLSSCETEGQRIAKLEWLHEYLPFLKDNLYIVVWEELGLSGHDRDFAKAHVIEGIVGYEEIYLIEDKHKVIKATNSIIENCAHHVSEVLK